MKFTESQFQSILCHYMMSYWTSVEVRNGLQIGDRTLFPMAREYAPKEDNVNDWFSGWGRGIDLLLLDRYGQISLVEMKGKSVSRNAVLRQLAQAYEGAYYLSQTSPTRLTSMFEDSFRVLFGAVRGRGESIFEDTKNSLFSVHQRFFKLEKALMVSDFRSLEPAELVLSLNPGEHFPTDAKGLLGLSAGDVLSELAKCVGKEESKCLERLKAVHDSSPSKLHIPVTLLEFSLSLSCHVAN